MSARRLAWIAAVAAWLAVLVGPLAIGLAYSFEVHARRPVLLMLGSAFLLSALVVAIRALLRHRVRGDETAPPEDNPARATLLVAAGAWVLLFVGPWVVVGLLIDDPRRVLYAADGVPWARLALLWLVASLGVAMPAASWCYRAGSLPEGPTRF